MIPDHRFRPEIVDQNTLLILDDSITIPLKMIGCNLDASGILKEWDELERSGFPLLFVSRLLVAWEIKDQEEGKFFLLPFPIHLVKILDSIQCIKHISGGSERINDLKKELCSLSFSAHNGSLEERRKSSIQIPKTILSCCDEFQIGCVLHQLYPGFRFSHSNGPDFNIEEIGVKMEALFESGSLERAFEHQRTDIAVMNMSHSQFGMLFAAHAFGLDNKDLGLSEAFEKAIKLARSGENVVLLYSEQVSKEQPYSICAIACDKQRVEYYGSRLDKVAKKLKIDTNTAEGYLRLIEEARKLN